MSRMTDKGGLILAQGYSVCDAPGVFCPESMHGEPSWRLRAPAAYRVTDQGGAP